MAQKYCVAAHRVLNLFFLINLLTVAPGWTQYEYANPSDRAAAEAAGCAACGGGMAFLIFLIVAIIALNIALLVWVARDAKSRGMDSSALWMLLVMFTGIIGLIIYLCARPQGNLVSCPACKNKRLQVSAKCPHCGNP